jgi:hypothetical protein
LDSTDHLHICDHAVLDVRTSTTGWDGEGNRHGGSATVRFDTCGTYLSTLTLDPIGFATSLELTGIGRSEIRSLVIGFEFAAASLRVLLDESPWNDI